MVSFRYLVGSPWILIVVARMEFLFLQFIEGGSFGGIEAEPHLPSCVGAVVQQPLELVRLTSKVICIGQDVWLMSAEVEL